VIPPESNLIGRAVNGVQLFKRPGVLRSDRFLRRSLQDVQLQLGDRIVLRTEMTELLSLQSNKSLRGWIKSQWCRRQLWKFWSHRAAV
jgi:hypothetical protein